MSSAVIFDVDGVLVDAPHERAWADTLARLAEGEWRDVVSRTRYRPEAFDTRAYQQFIAGKPRLDGARAILEHFGFDDASGLAFAYAREKQRRIRKLIDEGVFTPFPDGLRLVAALRRNDVSLAAASSSKNANCMMEKVVIEAKPASGAGLASTGQRTRLIDCFAANVCGQEVAGKPAPDIFLAAAAALDVRPADCVVVEDAPAGVAAAKNGGMKAVGVARLDDEAMLVACGADLVVRSLDEVAVHTLVCGTLASR
jgi:beta-phosphoglucomutase